MQQPIKGFTVSPTIPVSLKATIHQLLMKKGEQRSASHLFFSLSLSLFFFCFLFLLFRACCKRHPRPDTLLNVPHKAARNLRSWRAGKRALPGVNCPVTSALSRRGTSGARPRTSSSHFRFPVNCASYLGAIDNVAIDRSKVQCIDVAAIVIFAAVANLCLSIV